MRKDSILEVLENMVDVEKLKHSEELKTPIEDEVKRQCVDAAKKRAAAQNVDYPCFAALVSCAQLKPMTRKELESTSEFKNRRQKESIPAWFFDVSGHLQSHMSNVGTNKHIKSNLTKYRGVQIDDMKNRILLHDKMSHLSSFENSHFKDEEPTSTNQDYSKIATTSRVFNPINQARDKNGTNPLHDKRLTSEPQGLLYSSDMFIKEWKLLDDLPSIKHLRFLRKFSPSTLPIIFRVEIPPFLLGEILETLHATTLCKRIDSQGDVEDNDGVKLFVNNNYGNSTCLYRGYHSIGESRSVQVTQMKNKEKMDDSISNQVSQPNANNLQRNQEVHLKLCDFEKLVHWMVVIMDVLRSCGRFGLAVKLIGRDSRRVASEIIDYISGSINDPNLFSLLTNGASPQELLVSYNCI